MRARPARWVRHLPLKHRFQPTKVARSHNPHISCLIHTSTASFISITPRIHLYLVLGTTLPSPPLPVLNMDNEIFPMLDGRETRMRQHDNGYFTQSSQLPYKRPQKIPHSQEILQYSSYTSQPPASRGHAVPYADYDYDGFGVGGGEIPFGCFGEPMQYW